MIIIMGKGCIYGASLRQKINTKSYTEAELVGISDTLPQVIWYRNFLRDQGYRVNKSIIYQDYWSTIRLCINDRDSSIRRTHHIVIIYFFITNCHKYKEVRIEYCPKDDIMADFFCKPLQSAKFTKF